MLFEKQLKFKKLETFCEDSIDVPVDKDLLVSGFCFCKKMPPSNGIIKIGIKLNKPCKSPEFITVAGDKILIIQ